MTVTDCLGNDITPGREPEVEPTIVTKEFTPDMQIFKSAEELVDMLMVLELVEYVDDHELDFKVSKPFTIGWVEEG